ncbi:transcriptional regulator GcvA [Piscinibacter gummiphilus]|uniref:Transcriptional regulator GcvA n=1 Tax=Piscinibacter gummiphilus TaxID=946333 RepID=A0ABZ0D4I8_9BURK|nr:transcriptional regulator GcvA [Piscinibacter gummiphilus]WOB10436.1 transcriptional regulator GcvA [Piscinibacter gummiphilus]
MRRYRLPPLDLLEAFEAAARHLSFTRAADELALTQSAVSRQIAALEESLGVPLFQRMHRALRLTESGELFARTATGVLMQLQGATEQLRHIERQKTVVVTTTPGFAGLWLIPRLSSFTARYPGVDVRISASFTLVKLEREGVDIAIRYCASAVAGPQAVKLFGEVMTPVCSPALRRTPGKPLKKPEDLRHHTLLYTEQSHSAPLYDWSMWLRAMQLDIKPAAALYFSDYDQMVSAALRGQGVALGRLPLVDQLVRERKLVTPFNQSVASPMGYHLLRSETSADKPEVSDFSAWLMEEAAR